MRLYIVLVSFLVAGCLGPSYPPPQAYQQPPQESAQAQAYSQPQPILEPQSEPYQPPPPQPVYYDEPGYDTVNVDLTGESVGSIDVFFDHRTARDGLRSHRADAAHGRRCHGETKSM